MLANIFQKRRTPSRSGIFRRTHPHEKFCSDWAQTAVKAMHPELFQRMRHFEKKREQQIKQLIQRRKKVKDPFTARRLDEDIYKVSMNLAADVTMLREEIAEATYTLFIQCLDKYPAD